MDFGDSKFADGKLFIKLAESIDPKVVNWDLVAEGRDNTQKEMNTKYAISIARKLGAPAFLVCEDILTPNEKFIQMFLFSLYDLKYNKD